MPNMFEKRCACCRAKKALAEFGRDRYEPDGRRIYCKACTKQKRAARSADKIEAMRAYMQRYNATQKAREARKLYETTPAGRVARRRYRTSSHGRATLLHHTRMRQLRTRGQASALSKELRAEIKALYIEAKRLTDETGIPHDVDHIVPLARGGTHHPSNLRILPASMNRRLGSQLRRKAT